MVKKYYDSFLSYNKKHFTENKKLILINLSIFFGLILTLILIDQLTKTFLFEWKSEPDENGKWQGDSTNSKDYTLFGIRSVANYGVTIFGGLFPTWLLHVFSVFIFIVCALFALYSHDKLLIFAIAFTFAGTFGNFLDRAMFDGAVKDIIYFPWLQGINFLNGTFNFADVWLFAGSIIAISYIIVLAVKHYKHNKF